MSLATLLLLLLGATTSPARLPPEIVDVMASVTLLISDEHSTRCIQIFRGDAFSDSEREVIQQLWRALALPESHTTTGIYSFQTYIKRKLGKPWKVSCYKALKVLLGGEGSKSGFANLTNTIRVKDSVWLLFLDTDMETWLRGADLLFDCEVIVANIVSADLIVMYEVYRVRKGFPLRYEYYGNWTSDGGLTVVSGPLYERRSNLEGLVLRAGSIQAWPTVWSSGSKWYGFLPKMWTEIEEQTNSSAIYTEAPDGSIGFMGPNDTWNGLVGMVLRGEIDVIVATMIFENTRSRVLDLFHPLIYTSYQLYYRQLGYDLHWDSVFEPFGLSIWFAIIFWLFLGSFVISVCYYLSLMYGFEDDTSRDFGASRSFFFILQTLSQQGHDTVPRSAPCRILFFLSYLVSAILIPSYSASLISYLTLQIPHRPFDSLEEMRSQGSYRLLIKENTAEFGYFKNAKNQLLEDIFRHQIMPVPAKHKIHNTSHAFTIICNYPNYAFFGVEFIMNIWLGTTVVPTCPIITTTRPISSVYMTMGTIKNSPYSGLINYHLTKMMATGVANRIQNQEIPRSYQDLHPPGSQVALGEVLQMFIFVGLSMVVSVVILFIEKRYHAAQKRKNHPERSQGVAAYGYPKPVAWQTQHKSQQLLPMFMRSHDGFLN